MRLFWVRLGPTFSALTVMVAFICRLFPTCYQLRKTHNLDPKKGPIHK